MYQVLLGTFWHIALESKDNIMSHIHYHDWHHCL